MTALVEPQFVHRFIPASQSDLGITLLLLSGTGEKEQDLVSVGAELLPGAAFLSLRGQVLEDCIPRCLPSFVEGIFNVDDLKLHTRDLNDLVTAAAQQYSLAKNKVVAMGYSNGANIVASLLLLHPRALAGAVLFRPMLPFIPDFVPNLGRTSVLLSGGMQDPIVPRDATKTLVIMLTSFGAETELYWHPGGHELAEDDLDVAQQWLSSTTQGWQNSKRAASQQR